MNTTTNETQIGKEKLVRDLQRVITDAEELLHATAGQTEGKVAELRERIFSQIKAEWTLTRKHLLAILEQDEFLADNPMLARSLQLRLPYMDPLNHLQVELLKRHRAGEPDERVARGIHISINGIASGLRNSG